MSVTVVGVMGPGEGAETEEIEAAFELGRLIAGEGWVLLSGGRNVGVMDAANRGAKEAGGLTVGILPTKDTAGMSAAVDIPVLTDLGEARNNINILSSKVIFACGMGAGTASEIALAIKAKKRVLLLEGSPEWRAFFARLGGGDVILAGSPREAIEIARRLVRDEDATTPRKPESRVMR